MQHQIKNGESHLLVTFMLQHCSAERSTVEEAGGIIVPNVKGQSVSVS